GRPVEVPKTPGELSGIPVEHRLFPLLIVDLDLDGGEWRRSPGHSANPVASISHGNARWGRLQQQFPDGRFDRGCRPVVLLLANRDAIATHKATHVTRIAHLDTVQPLHVGDSVPPWGNQACRI